MRDDKTVYERNCCLKAGAKAGVEAKESAKQWRDERWTAAGERTAVNGRTAAVGRTTCAGGRITAVGGRITAAGERITVDGGRIVAADGRTDTRDRDLSNKKIYRPAEAYVG